MISVVIATLNSERTMLPTLSALVPGAVEGLVTEVIVADRGSHDGIAVVADAAGCRFMAVDGPPGRALRAAASAARAPWLLFLRPGTLLDAAWISEAARFVERPATDGGAAVFRSAPPAKPSLRAAFSMVVEVFGALARPDQGLLLARQFYDALGGHSEQASDPEADLLRRIGRRRLVTLASAAHRMDT